MTAIDFTLPGNERLRARSEAPGASAKELTEAALADRLTVVYRRQSRDAENDGEAVARQLDACMALAERRGLTVARVYTDNDVSATSKKPRPAYNEMIAAVESGEVGTILVWAIDRLTRKVTDFEALIDLVEVHKLSLCTVDGDIDLSTDTGRLIGRILASVAKGEVERKVRRQKLESNQAATAGKVPQRRSFGYNRDGTKHDTEAPALLEMYGLVVGGLSTLGAMRWLNDRGFTTTSGRTWDRSSVAALIRNPRNCGWRTLRGVTVGAGTWDPIVDDATWRAAGESISNPKTQGKVRNARKWLGGGTFYCHCGAKIRSNYSHHGTRVYQCQKSSHLSRSAEPIDRYVNAKMAELLNDQEALARLVAPETVDVVGPLRTERIAINARLKRVMELHMKDKYTEEQMLTANATAEVRLAEIDRALTEAGRESRLAHIVGKEDPAAYWLGLKDLNLQKGVLDAVMKVTVLTASPGRKPFDEDTVRIERP